MIIHQPRHLHKYYVLRKQRVFSVLYTFGTLYINYSSVLIKNALHYVEFVLSMDVTKKNTLKQS